jgi:hypothetical protein
MIKGEKMSIEQQAEKLTKAYIVSYNIAIKEVRNPELAVQIAEAVVVAINGTLPKQSVEVDSFVELFVQMIAEINKNLDG